MEKKKLSLPAQIFISLAIGIAVGLVFNATGMADITTKYFKPFGTIFVNLLKFIVVPVVLLSMIQGIVSMGDIKKVGSVGWKTVAMFLVTTAIAGVIGLTFAGIFKNAGLFNLQLSLAEGDKWTKATSANFMDTLVNIFPTNMWGAFHNADMLQVIVIAVFFGASILVVGQEKAKPVVDFINSAYEIIAALMAFIISLSPVGVFTMMAWVVATQGPAVLGALAKVILCAYLAYIVHTVVVYSIAIAAFSDNSPAEFFRKASPAMLFAFTSTSSAATLPVSLANAEELGCDKPIASFVLPLGSTIHMDGTAIYQCVACVFLAKLCGIDLTLAQLVTIIVTSTLASIGTAGTPGAGMIMLAMVLTAMGIPTDMIMIIYGVDRIFDMGRTCLNVAGDICTTCCVTKWEKAKK